ncbi:hypothetical protein [Nonomuraea sp. SYSU D8015]|uniref:hypothetical protein n=1 Tax=Nonomuraea sp. SYSU D8015 TaxID=2593644 RepID=UPI0016605539|nr:hypothetical protein [Nonomuraea sp. SYSU D8015]
MSEIHESTPEQPVYLRFLVGRMELLHQVTIPSDNAGRVEMALVVLRREHDTTPYIVCYVSEHSAKFGEWFEGFYTSDHVTAYVEMARRAKLYGIEVK